MGWKVNKYGTAEQTKYNYAFKGEIDAGDGFFLHILLIRNGELEEENDCAVTGMNLIGNIYFNLLRYLDLNYTSNFSLQTEKCFSTLL